jgi:hypothetical protein
MYPIKVESKGYTFETINGVKYLLYFNPLEPSILNNASTSFNYVYFGIERMLGKSSKKDIFIERTIVFMIVSFFIENPNSILVFNYSNEDDLLLARRRLFYRWFQEYRTHTTYQFYQHDFSNTDTVCALYKRTGGHNFDSIKEDIERAISNIDFGIKGSS